MSTLCLHVDASEIEANDYAEALAAYPVPDATATYQPVRHDRLRELLLDRVDAAGFRVFTERYGLNDAGTKLFGLIELESVADGPDPMRQAIAVRNSYDKSMRVGLGVGGNVFVCDNLALSADYTWSRKHTLNVWRDLAVVVDTFVARLPEALDVMSAQVDLMQVTRVTLGEAARYLLDDKTLPGSKAQRVWQEFNEPSEDHGDPLSVWSLYNAYTRVAKSYDLVRQGPAVSAAMGAMADRWGCRVSSRGLDN